MLTLHHTFRTPPQYAPLYLPRTETTLGSLVHCRGKWCEVVSVRMANDRRYGPCAEVMVQPLDR